MGQLGGNSYDWVGKQAANMAMTRWIYRRFGTITDTEGLARQSHYYADEFIRPDHVPAKWLAMKPKKFVKWLHKHGVYEGDPEHYGQMEHWECPAEFIVAQLKGDCDAFAIAVASHFIASGFSVEDIRLCLGKRFKENETDFADPINHVWALVYDYPEAGRITLADATPPLKGLLAWPQFQQAEKTWGYKPHISFTKDGSYWEHFR